MSEAWQPLPMLHMWQRALRIRQCMRQEERERDVQQADASDWRGLLSENENFLLDSGRIDTHATTDLEVQESFLVKVVMSARMISERMLLYESAKLKEERKWNKWDEWDEWDNWDNWNKRTI